MPVSVELFGVYCLLLVGVLKCAEMSVPFSPLTTHILNTGMGVPASNMELSLHRLDPSNGGWTLLFTG